MSVSAVLIDSGIGVSSAPEATPAVNVGASATASTVTLNGVVVVALLPSSVEVADRVKLKSTSLSAGGVKVRVLVSMPVRSATPASLIGTSTPLADKLDAVRGWRDRNMLNNAVGTAAADAYYRFSRDILARFDANGVGASCASTSTPVGCAWL